MIEPLNKLNLKPAKIACAGISVFYLICLWIYHFEVNPTEAIEASRLYTIISLMPVTGYFLLAVFFFSVMLPNPKAFELPPKMLNFTLIWIFVSVVGILALYLFAAITFFTFAPLLMKYGPAEREIRIAINAGLATFLWGMAGGYMQFRLVSSIFTLDSWTRNIWRNGMILISLTCVFLPMPFIVFKWFGWDWLLNAAIAAISVCGWFRLLDKTGPIPYHKRLPIKKKKLR